MSGPATPHRLVGQPAPDDGDRSGRPLWSRSTSVALILVGAVLSIAGFTLIIAMGDLTWHPARHAELVATYETYQDTGVLLIKPTGTGSSVTQVPGAGEYTFGAWDDDPGAYLLASLAGNITGSASPYPGLRAAMAVLVAFPLLVLPTAVARVFGRARAGYAIALLPPVMWLIGHGTALLGTQYGQSDVTSPTPVYALYGLAASMAFLSLTLLLYLSTRRLRLVSLISWSVALAMLAGVGNLMRSLSGLGIAVAVGVLWWLNGRRKGRWWRAAVAGALAVVIAMLLPAGVMRAVDSGRAAATGVSVADLPDAHTLWHSLYLGLSYPGPLTGEASPFDIVWSDEFGWEKAREVDPDVLIGGVEHNEIMKELYLDEVREKPLTALGLYASKGWFTLTYFGGVILLALLGIVLALTRHGPHRRALIAGVVLTLPTLALGFVPPVLVMPMLYYYSELTAASSLLAALGLGSLVWVVTSLASRARAAQRMKVTAHLSAPEAEASDTISVVLPIDSGVTGAENALESFGTLLSAADEVIAIDRGSERSGAMTSLVERWSHPSRLTVLDAAGLGDGLGAATLTSTGRRVLICTEELDGERSGLERFRGLPVDTSLAITSPDGADPGDRDRHRGGPWAVRTARELILSPAVHETPTAIWVDGGWARTFAAFARESGDLWTTEMLLAAEEQGVAIIRVELPATGAPNLPSRRITVRDFARQVRGFVRLAM